MVELWVLGEQVGEGRMGGFICFCADFISAHILYCNASMDKLGIDV